ncbi:MAG: hypothetical protein AAGG79_07525 [Pseudomonadota bacterium]
MRARLSLLLALAMVAVSAVAGAAEQNAPPSGMGILIVSGDVPHPNRGPAAAGAVDLFGKLGVSFEKAVEFDLDGLKALDQKEIEGFVEPEVLEGTFSGPLLADVLSAAGLPISDVIGVGLDGYRKDITREAIEKYDPIVALYVNGKLLQIGGYGPTSIVFPTSPDDAVNTSNQNMQPWATFYLEAK